MTEGTFFHAFNDTYRGALLTAFLLLPLLAGGLAGCRCDACHEWERGLVLALDRSLCPDIPVTGDITLCIYATDGQALTVRYYDDPRDVASLLLPLRAGHYTIAATVNAQPDKEATASLTALHEWLVAQAPDCPQLLSGVTEADVAAEGISRVLIPLQPGAFPLPVLDLRLTLPEPSLPDYSADRAMTRAGDDAYIIRCVAELTRPGTNQVTLRKAVTPTLLADGTRLVELSVPEGSYDLRLWTDYARADAPLADLHYHTESLRAVSIVTNPYTADADAKDAACYYEENFSLSAAGKEIPVQLQRPLAKLRLVASDAEDYRRLTATAPKNYPPLEELTLTVQYEGFFPSELNIGSGRVTDAVTGMACSTAVTEDVETDGLTLFTEWVLTGGESSVSATLTLSDRNGRPVCNVSQVKMDYRKGHLTTLRGRFLTAGVSSGGITIDTGWEEIIIPF